MKKLLLVIIFSMAFSVNAAAGQMKAINNTLSFDPVKPGNDGITYSFVQSDNCPGIINIAEDYAYIDVFDSSGIKLEKSEKIKLTESKVGGYAFDGSYHYFLLGNDNQDCRDSITVYKVVKYDTSFNKMGTCIIKGSMVNHR